MFHCCKPHHEQQLECKKGWRACKVQKIKWFANTKSKNVNSMS